MSKKKKSLSEKILQKVNKDIYSKAFDDNQLPCHILKLVDSESGVELINRSGKEMKGSQMDYAGFRFSIVIGSIFLTNRFVNPMPIQKVVEYGKLPKTVGFTKGWDTIIRELNGRPCGITKEELKRKVLPLMRAKVGRMVFFTKSMALGLHSWFANAPENKELFEKYFGRDEWFVMANSPLPEGKSDYEAVNQALKKMKVEYRVKTTGMAVARLMRQDLWD